MSAHIRFVEKSYGKEVIANWGWSQGDDYVCTKIYGSKYKYAEGREVVTSEISKGGKITHLVTEA